MLEYSDNGVQKFFSGRSIFVTGGTGFMGKVLVEKLLWSCSNIKNIYILMRPKRGHDVSQRLVQLLNAPLFERLRDMHPELLKKIVPIEGDITEAELGISASDQELLRDTVSVVFHTAATVKFDEALKLSVTINMLGTKRLLDLCHTMTRLEALIHVSTAYCNCDRDEVNEEIYPPPYDPENIIHAMEWMDDDLIQTLTPKLIGKRPNTYTFTKALTEHMLLKESGNLPVAIVRPSIVISSLREPMAGWVDNWNGPTGIIAAAGKGFFRSMLCHENKVADLVPVDMVINLMICAAWRTATARPNGIVVYNCCTGEKAPITWKEFVNQCFVSMRKHPVGDLMWYPDGKCRSSSLANTFCSITMHYFPAYLIDAVSWLSGKKPIMVRVQNKLEKAAKCLHYFATREWKFVGENTGALYQSLSECDRYRFAFDVRRIHWPSYIEAYVLGIRQFIFKEPLESLPAARNQLKKLYLLHRLTQATIILAFVWLATARSAQVHKYWYALFNWIVRIARMIPLPA